MNNAQQSSRKPFCIGLFFRTRGRSRFWGVGEPPAVQRVEAPVMHTQERTGKEATAHRRVSFAGFVFWRRPRPEEKSDNPAFFSLSDRASQSLHQAEQQTPAAQPGRKWRPTRIAAPGQYFLGFVRRERS